jgi:Major intrinsic protein
LFPLGQRSGGDLNPTVTWAFWRKGKVKLADAILYTVAQCLGALAGVGVFVLMEGTSAKSVRLGVTSPGRILHPGGLRVGSRDHPLDDVFDFVLCRKSTNRRADSIFCWRARCALGFPSYFPAQNS